MSNLTKFNIFKVKKNIYTKTWTIEDSCGDQQWWYPHDWIQPQENDKDTNYNCSHEIFIHYEIRVIFFNTLVGGQKIQFFTNMVCNLTLQLCFLLISLLTTIIHVMCSMCSSNYMMCFTCSTLHYPIVFP
jgi:hypothetical protein